MNENKIFDAQASADEKEITVEKNDAQAEFLRALKTANSSYLNIVMTCACLALCGIPIAIYVRLLFGIAAAIASVVAYMIATKTLLSKTLGISYETTSGALTVTKLCAKDKEEIFIPRRLLWVDVTQLGDKAFAGDSSKNMKTVHLPSTLTFIGEDIFEGCEALECVYFEGSQEDFEKIENHTDFSKFQLVFCDSADYAIKKQKRSKKSSANKAEASDEKENG